MMCDKKAIMQTFEAVGRWKVNDWIRMALEKRYASGSMLMRSLLMENEVRERHFLSILTRF